MEKKKPQQNALISLDLWSNKRTGQSLQLTIKCTDIVNIIRPFAAAVGIHGFYNNCGVSRKYYPETRERALQLQQMYVNL